MTHTERMNAGMIYDPGADEIMSVQVPYQVRLREFNKLSQTDLKGKEKYMKEVFAECGDNCYIELPFYANWGGHHVHFGSNIYANFGLTLVDDGEIFIGDCVLFGPHVTVATANHPINPELRSKSYQYNKDVHIGNNVWIGAGAVIVPGVTIGDNCVIGAGSVVTKNIPENSVAVGNPCRVIRSVGEKDDEFFYKDERIDDEMKEFIKNLRNR